VTSTRTVKSGRSRVHGKLFKRFFALLTMQLVG
jgi:hypothetical protein